MRRGTVRGSIVATKRLWDAPKGALLKIELDKEDGGGHLIAFDTLGCGHGERVLVAEGSGAAAWFPGKGVPVDALIIGAIEKESGDRLGETEQRGRTGLRGEGDGGARNY